ncbi:MAG TPA: hypothetical protein VIJ31_11990 [Acidothermaceae bacterium]|jgi:hypothetical protein|nr:hypothetical protein [Acidothermaceae bacterium]
MDDLQVIGSRSRGSVMRIVRASAALFGTGFVAGLVVALIFHALIHALIIIAAVLIVLGFAIKVMVTRRRP